MTVLCRLDGFLLFSAPGETALGAVVTTGTDAFLSLPANPRQSPLFVGRIIRVLLLVWRTWCGLQRFELERAVSNARSRNFENQLRDANLTARNESVAAAKFSEEAAIAALRLSFSGLESQAAISDMATATTSRAYLALLDQEGLTADLVGLAHERNDGDPLP